MLAVQGRSEATVDTTPVDPEAMPRWMEDHEGQKTAWHHGSKTLALLAGWQSGKTDFLVEWCFRAAGRYGPGDALVLAPSHKLLEYATQPRVVKRFGTMADWKGGSCCLTVPESSLKRLGWTGECGDLRIWFRHTQDPKAVEAVTAIWVAFDECGQSEDEVWEAVQGRVSKQVDPPVLLISRPYFDNWYRAWCEANPEKVVNFASWDNPGWKSGLTREEKKASVDALGLPEWRKDMKFGGVFTRPAGAVYDCYVDKMWDDPEEPGHLEAPFLVPPWWERAYGIDFGPVHTAVRCYAKDPELKSEDGFPVWHNYRTYFPNVARDTWQHVDLLKKWEEEDARQWLASGGWKDGRSCDVQWPPAAFGGNASEDKWRQAWTDAGLPVMEPVVTDPYAAIDAVYQAFRKRRVRHFSTLQQAIKETKRYSWQVDDDGEPIPGKLPDKASTFHLCDAERHVAWLFAGSFMAAQQSRYRKEA